MSEHLVSAVDGWRPAVPLGMASTFGIEPAHPIDRLRRMGGHRRKASGEIGRSGLQRRKEGEATGDAQLLDANVPMHHQVYSQLKREILDGLWMGRPGFPGETELTSMFDISLITSRRALERLAREGLVRRERGRRPMAIYDPREARQPDSAPEMFPVGPSPFEYKMLSFGVEHVPIEACLAYGVPPGTPLWAWRRLRLFDARPHSVTFNVQRVDVGESLDPAFVASMSMREALNQVGRIAVRLSRKIEVTFPDPGVARNLEISLQEPIRRYTYQSYDSDGETLDWVRILLHPREVAPVETFNLVDHTWENLGLV